MSSFSVASPSQKKDLSILGLQSDRFGRLPDNETIKKAYRSRALLCHPDKNPNAAENSNAAFLELQGAYENLTSPLKLKEEKLKQQQQQQQAAHPGTSTSATNNNNNGFGDGYTYNVPKTSAFARTRTPPASSSSRPAFCTKPASKFGNNGNSCGSPNTASFPSSSPSSSSFHSHHQQQQQQQHNMNKARTSTPTSSSSARRNSFGNSTSSSSSSPFSQQQQYSSSSSSSSPSTSATQNILPGTPLIPPPFPSSNSAAPSNSSRNHFATSINNNRNNNIYTSTSSSVKAPFPAFLVDGRTYHFETDPSAFGIYSKLLRHGDTAKISVPVFQPELGQEVETIVTGIVIGVAADNNLYWWKIDDTNNGYSLENIATFLAPKIPQTAYQQAHKVTIVKQQVPMMSPLNFNTSGCGRQSNSFSSTSSSTATTPSSNKNNLKKGDNDDDDATFLFVDSEELFAVERERRIRILKIYDMWLGEAIWCFNLPTFSNADAVRFSRVVR